MQDVEKICTRCKKQFYSKYDSKIYCSKACKRAIHKRRERTGSHFNEYYYHSVNTINTRTTKQAQSREANIIRNAFGTAMVPYTIKAQFARLELGKKIGMLKVSPEKAKKIIIQINAGYSYAAYE